MIVGLGIDAIDIDRIKRMYDDKGQRMLDRLFRADELAYLATKPEPAQHLAVRLAAKEAAYKALSGTEMPRARTRPSRRPPETARRAPRT